jgi:hypothetical protein
MTEIVLSDSAGLKTKSQSLQYGMITYREGR